MAFNIILATGGTGGHIFPALALKQTLKSSDLNVIITGDDKFQKYHNFDEEHIHIPSANFANKSIIAIFKTLITLAKGFFKSIWLIYNKKPNLVVGFGGYASYPVILAAALMNKKIILHEANTVIGKANKLMLWKALFLTTGFKTIKNIPDKYLNKVVFTGNPIRSEISIKLDKDLTKLSLLVIGGSQGAKVFSKMIPDMIVNLPQNIKEHLHVIQQVREEDIELIKERYSLENVSCEIKPFFEDMDEKFKEANLVIARAGASTISELIKVKLPAILIPYPTAADNHQYYNAKELVDNKASWLVEENSDSSIQLLQIIKSIDRNKSVLYEYSANLAKLDSDGNYNLSHLIKQTLSKSFQNWT